MDTCLRGMEAGQRGQARRRMRARGRHLTFKPLLVLLAPGQGWLWLGHGTPHKTAPAPQHSLVALASCGGLFDQESHAVVVWVGQRRLVAPQDRGHADAITRGRQRIGHACAQRSVRAPLGAAAGEDAELRTGFWACCVDAGGKHPHLSARTMWAQSQRCRPCVAASRPWARRGHARRRAAGCPALGAGGGAEAVSMQVAASRAACSAACMPHSPSHCCHVAKPHVLVSAHLAGLQGREGRERCQTHAGGRWQARLHGLHRDGSDS